MDRFSDWRDYCTISGRFRLCSRRCSLISFARPPGWRWLYPAGFGVLPVCIFVCMHVLHMILRSDACAPPSRSAREIQAYLRRLRSAVLLLSANPLHNSSITPRVVFVILQRTTSNSSHPFPRAWRASQQVTPALMCAYVRYLRVECLSASMAPPPSKGGGINHPSRVMRKTDAPDPEKSRPEAGSRAPVSNARRYTLFATFCVANMLDAYNLNALFTALPALKRAFGLGEADASWVMSAFQLTYAAFLLVSGRISDVYHPKSPFVVGVLGLAILSLGAGFVKNGVGLIILRAICGICAALSIPSSLALIVRLFPEPREQSVAIALFGGVAALANVFGTMVSAVFIEFASYRWVFFLTTIVGAPASLVCLILVPREENHVESGGGLKARVRKLKRLDLVGVTLLTVALVLFIFAITSGSEDGWSSAQVLAPLIISVFMIAAFFVWEAWMPTEDAAVPPRTWFLPNFAVLFGASLLPYFWWTTVFVVFFPLWQQVYGWSAIKSGLRMIPIGVSATAISFTSSSGRYVSRKTLIVFGHVIAIGATILLAFGDAEDKYWRLVFPGLILGSAGAMTIYMHVSIAIFQTAPPTMAGVVGAMFNCAIQLGAALGLAIDTSIETSIELRDGADGFQRFDGRRAVLWWLVAAVCAEMVAILIFYRADKPRTAREEDYERPQPSAESVSKHPKGSRQRET